MRWTSLFDFFVEYAAVDSAVVLAKFLHKCIVELWCCPHYLEFAVDGASDKRDRRLHEHALKVFQHAFIDEVGITMLYQCLHVAVKKRFDR